MSTSCIKHYIKFHQFSSYDSTVLIKQLNEMHTMHSQLWITVLDESICI